MSDETKQRVWQIAHEVARDVLTFFALLVMILVIVDNNADKTDLKKQLNVFKQERVVADQVASDKLECARRYQTIVNQTSIEQSILIGEFLVIITQIPPGDERSAAVTDKINTLDATNKETRAAVEAQNDYNNSGTPLPCPIQSSP